METVDAIRNFKQDEELSFTWTNIMVTVDLKTNSTEIAVRIQQIPATRIPDHVTISEITASINTKIRINQCVRTASALLLTQHNLLSMEMFAALTIFGILLNISVVNTMTAETCRSIGI